MKSWAPLWNGLVDSSIWEEPDHVFRTFIAMLSLKDHNNLVTLDGYKLARRIHMPPDKVEDALRILSSPDTKRPAQEFEGRRIKKVDDGWEILNGAYYRSLVQEEMKRARNRRAQAAFRERQKVKSTPLPGEAGYVKDIENHGHEVADANLDKAQNGHAAPRPETALERVDREMREKREREAQQNRGGDQA